MNYEVIGTAESGIELDKRTYIPGIIIRGTCEHCGNPVERNLGDDYLSYPVLGKVEEESFYCTYGDGEGEEFCGENTSFWIRVDLTVTAVEAP